MMTTPSYSYRLYAGNGNWITLGTKTTQDLLEIFEKGVSCRYPLTDQLFIDIIPHDVDCNSKNIDMLGLMRADLVYEPLDSESQVQQNMSYYVHSLLNEQGIIDAFPPLRSDGILPNVDSLPAHRHLSLVPSTVNSAKRRTRRSDSLKQIGSTGFSSGSASESPMLEPIHPFLPLVGGSSSSYGFNIPSTPGGSGSIQKKGKYEDKSSSHSFGSSSTLSSTLQKNSDTSASDIRRPYHTRSSSTNSNNNKKKMSNTNLENTEHNDTLYDRMNNHHHHHHVDNLEWLDTSSSPLWIPSNSTSYPTSLRGHLAFYNNNNPPAKLEQHDSHPISPADIMHHYPHFTSKDPMINMTHSAFEIVDRQDCIQQRIEENVHYNDSDNSMGSIMSPIPWKPDNKKLNMPTSWEENRSDTTSPTVINCLDYEKYLPPFNERDEARSNILSHN